MDICSVQAYTVLKKNGVVLCAPRWSGHWTHEVLRQDAEPRVSPAARCARKEGQNARVQQALSRRGPGISGLSLAIRLWGGSRGTWGLGWESCSYSPHMAFSISLEILSWVHIR